MHEQNNTEIYRKGLPKIPERLLKLPVERGYPVPWFVAFVEGHYDFRVMDGSKIIPAIQQKLCWVCGEKLGSALAFTIGPMCAINRTISEPPSHRECAEFSIKACPFLNQTESRRREAGLPEDAVGAAGMGLKRQPGVICLWITKKFKPFNVPSRNGANAGILFSIGEPDQVFWFCEGRAATRKEILASIESGLPSLMELAEQQGSRAIDELNRRKNGVYQNLLPSETRKRNLFASAAK